MYYDVIYLSNDKAEFSATIAPTFEWFYTYI